MYSHIYEYLHTHGHTHTNDLFQRCDITWLEKWPSLVEVNEKEWKGGEMPAACHRNVWWSFFHLQTLTGSPRENVPKIHGAKSHIQILQDKQSVTSRHSRGTRAGGAPAWAKVQSHDWWEMAASSAWRWHEAYEGWLTEDKTRGKGDQTVEELDVWGRKGLGSASVRDRATQGSDREVPSLVLLRDASWAEGEHGWNQKWHMGRWC